MITSSTTDQLKSLSISCVRVLNSVKFIVPQQSVMQRNPLKDMCTAQALQQLRARMANSEAGEPDVATQQWFLRDRCKSFGGTLQSASVYITSAGHVRVHDLMERHRVLIVVQWFPLMAFS